VVLPIPVYQVTLDCPEPRDLAEFYRGLLGWTYLAGHEEADPDGDEWLVLQAPGHGLRLAFQRSDRMPRAWREDARLHLDLGVPDLVAAHRHAVAVGARPLTGTPQEEGHADDPFRVYADPVGHPFCLTEHRDGPPTVGQRDAGSQPAG
jgi:Glyoxalase-like domain